MKRNCNSLEIRACLQFGDNTNNDSPVIFLISKTSLFFQECCNTIKAYNFRRVKKINTNAAELDWVCKFESVLHLCYCSKVVFCLFLLFEFFLVSG